MPPRSFTALAILGPLLAGCASGGAYDNYADWMQQQVGKNVDDPSAYRNRYPNERVAAKKLPNGNIEEVYRRGRGGRCPTYFEIDPTSQKIVGWRHEGTKDDCGIVP